jgi:hypothetical protein
MRIIRRIFKFLPLFLAIFLVPAKAHAQADVLAWIGSRILGAGAEITIDLLMNVLNSAAFLVSFLITTILGLLITFEVFLFQVVLSLNTQVMNSAPVKFGFPVALGFTNLLFVVAILVIAMATIVRWDSYAVKNTLWKLVLIAIMINFGLVIASAILSFGDNLTAYFITAVDPVGGELSGAEGSSVQSYTNFAMALGGAFAPQRLFATPTSTGLAAGTAIRPLFGILFTLLGHVGIFIVLGGLVIMFLHRYVTLAYLMIVLPLAWAGFIFKKTEAHWTNWWKTFLNQVFFAPVAIFMIWIALQTSYEMSKGGSAFGIEFAEFTSTATNPVWATLSKTTGDIFSSITQSALEVILMISIMGGGLKVAKNMGGAGADLAQKIVVDPINKFQGWAKNRAKEGAKDAGRGAVTPTLNRLQSRGGLVGKVAGGVKGLIGSPKPFKVQDETINKYKKEIADSGTPVSEIAKHFNDNRANMSAEERMAHLEHLQKEKALWQVKNTKDLDTPEMQDEFKRYRRSALQTQLFNDTGYAVIKSAHSNNPDDLGGLTRTKNGSQQIATLASQLQKAKEDQEKALQAVATGKYANGKDVPESAMEDLKKQTKAFDDKLSSMGTTKDEWEKELLPKIQESLGENMASGHLSGFEEKLSEFGGTAAVQDWANKAVANPKVAAATMKNAPLYKFATTSAASSTRQLHKLVGIDTIGETEEEDEEDASTRRATTTAGASTGPAASRATPPGPAGAPSPPTI